MKLSIFTILLTVLVRFASAQSSTITVVIEGIKNIDGNILIRLYSNKSDFGIYDIVFLGVATTPLINKITYNFKDIPEGTYAIATWHDDNDNKKIVKNFLGIPIEKYGFSLNQYSKFGLPNFDDVSFEIGKGENIKLSIQLK